MSIDHEAAKEAAFHLSHNTPNVTEPCVVNLALAHIDLHEQLSAERSKNHDIHDAVNVAIDRLHDESDEHDIAAARMTLTDAVQSCSYEQSENEVLREKLTAERARVDALAELVKNGSKMFYAEQRKEAERIMEGRA